MIPKPEQVGEDKRPTDVDLVNAFYEVFNSWKIDEAVEFLRDDFEWRPAFGRGLMGGNAYVGRDGFRRYCEDIREGFTQYRVDLRALESVGREQVLAHVRAAAIGRASGVGVDRDFWILYTLRDGQIARGETFDERAQALNRAVGI